MLPNDLGTLAFETLPTKNQVITSLLGAGYCQRLGGIAPRVPWHSKRKRVPS